MAGKKRPSVGLILTLIIVLGGFGYLIYGGLDENLVYFLTHSELMAKGDSAQDKPVRLGGMVVPGSVKWDAKTIDLRFTLSDSKGTILVHSQKAPPQMFRRAGRGRRGTAGEERHIRIDQPDGQALERIQGAASRHGKTGRRIQDTDQASIRIGAGFRLVQIGAKVKPAPNTR